jgi:hypothetical protein
MRVAPMGELSPQKNSDKKPQNITKFSLQIERHLSHNPPLTDLLVMSASPQIAQGAGSNVGSTVCAPTRVKDAGNSNLGTFGVCVLPRSSPISAVTQSMCLRSVGQIWPRPDAKGAHVLPFDYPCIPDLEQGGVIMDVVNAEQVRMPYAHCTLL